MTPITARRRQAGGGRDPSGAPVRRSHVAKLIHEWSSSSLILPEQFRRVTSDECDILKTHWSMFADELGRRHWRRLNWRMDPERDKVTLTLWWKPSRSIGYNNTRWGEWG